MYEGEWLGDEKHGYGVFRSGPASKGRYCSRADSDLRWPKGVVYRVGVRSYLHTMRLFFCTFFFNEHLIRLIILGSVE